MLGGSFISSGRFLFCAGLAALLGIFAAAQTVTAQPPAAKAGRNPFGLYLYGRQLDARAKQQLLRETFQVPYCRPGAVYLDRFARSGEVGPDVAMAAEAGIKLVLVVRNNGAPYRPTSPPKDLKDYKRVLERVIHKVRPSLAVLVIENEQNNANLFWSGTAAQYLAQLRAASQVAHDHDLKIADGGIGSTGIIALMAKRLLSEGKVEQAVTLVQRTRDPRIRNESQLRALLKCKAGELTQLKRMIEGYKDCGADFVNFHWYENDPEAFRQAIAFLHEESGLPVMTSELGQHTDNPAETQWKLQLAREFKLPYIIWFSMDSLRGRSLINEDGTLRPTGEVFKKYVGGLGAAR